MPGIQINSLQDILMLRELKNQANPTYSAMKALADGVAGGIEEERAKKKQTKAMAEHNENVFKQYSNFNNSNSKRIEKLQPSLKLNKEGILEFTAKTPTPETAVLRSTRIKNEEEIRIMNEQSRTIDAFFEPNSTLTQIDLMDAEIDPSKAEKMFTARNIFRQQQQNKINIQNQVIGQPTNNQQGISQQQEKTSIRGGDLVAKGFDVEQQIPKDVISKSGISQEKQVLKWSDEAAQRNIKVAVLDPKLQGFMDVGARAYKELKEVSKKELGVDLNFSKGGTNFYKNLLIKKGLKAAKLTPLMVALDNLRPEIGTELMRQLGAFRSAQMAQKFENTLAKFNGNIKEDIANMATTISKNAANIDLVDENGNIRSQEETTRIMNGAEANFIRKYNFMYREMGLIDKPYTAQRSFKWLAENSDFNNSEQALIQKAVGDNKGYDTISVIAKLIEQGLL